MRTGFSLAVLFFALIGVNSARPDDLPSPDAMWLGQRLVPRAIVEGYRRALEEDAVGRAAGSRVATADLPPLQARAHAVMGPLLDEAFPPELLAGLAAQFLAAHYSADELRALREHEESPLGRKLREFDRRAAELSAPTPAAREEARDALARRTFTREEQRQLEAFAASPLGRKGMSLAPDLASFFVDRLDRRYVSIRADLDVRLRNAAEGVLATR